MSQDIEKVAKEIAPDIARRLVAAADPSRPEADFRRQATQIIDDAASRAGITLSVRDEYRVFTGKIDSVYNRLVVEYERPAVLRDANTSPGNKHAVGTFILLPYNPSGLWKTIPF